MPDDHLESVWNGRDSLTSHLDDHVLPRETSNERWCPACRRWKPRKAFLLKSGYRACKRCRSTIETARSRQMRAAAKTRGLCGRCRRNTPNPGNSLCRSCLENIRNNAKARATRRRALNRCTHCGAHNDNPKSRWYCLGCSQDRYDSNARAIAKAIDNGLCRTCRINPVAERKGRPTKRCNTCLLNDAAGAKRRRAAAKTAIAT